MTLHFDLSFLNFLPTCQCLACGRILPSYQGPAHHCDEANAALNADPGAPQHYLDAIPHFAFHAYTRHSRSGS